MPRVHISDGMQGGTLRRNVEIETIGQYIEEKSYPTEKLKASLTRDGNDMKDVNWETPLQEHDFVNLMLGSVKSGS